MTEKQADADTVRMPPLITSASDTQLYLVEDSGERWWVSARSAERVMRVLIAEMGEIEEWKDDPPSITRVMEEDVAERKFTFEDGEKCRLWNAFSLVRGFECVLATTCI